MAPALAQASELRLSGASPMITHEPIVQEQRVRGTAAGTLPVPTFSALESAHSSSGGGSKIYQDSRLLIVAWSGGILGVAKISADAVSARIDPIGCTSGNCGAGQNRRRRRRRLLPGRPPPPILQQTPDNGPSGRRPQRRHPRPRRRIQLPFRRARQRASATGLHRAGNHSGAGNADELGAENQLAAKPRRS